MDKAASDRNVLADEKLDFVLQIQSLKEQLADKDLSVQGEKAQVKLLDEENKKNKQDKVKLESRLEEIENNFFLISKQPGDTSNAEQLEDTDLIMKQNIAQNMVEEVRSLHQQLKEKEVIQTKLLKLAEGKGGDDLNQIK